MKIIKPIFLLALLFTSLIYSQDIITFDDQNWNNDQVLNSNFNIGNYSFSSDNNFYTNYGYNFNVNENSLYYVFQNPSTDKITITTKDNTLVKFISVDVYQVSETSMQGLIIEGWNGTTRLYQQSFSDINSWQTLTLNYSDINKVIIKLPLTSTSGLTDFNFDNFSLSTVPLPVELTSFNAVSKENCVSLVWQTATEINNYGFDVERSTDQQTKGLKEIWEKIGFVLGNGTSTISNRYSFIDNSVINGYKFKYRLKQIDANGDFKYSGEIEITADLTLKNFSLSQNYPNPFNPTTSIQYAVVSNQFVSLKVYDILGNVVATLVNDVKSAGSYKVEFDPGKLGLSSGIYIYKLATNGFVSTKKMVMLK